MRENEVIAAIADMIDCELKKSPVDADKVDDLREAIRKFASWHLDVEI